MTTPDPTALKNRRNVFLYLMIEAAMQKNIIKEPLNFRDNMNYTKKIYTDMDIEDGKASIENPDYYMNRGFIMQIDRTFTDEHTPYTIEDYTNETVEEETYPHRDFLFYVRASMFYTKAEFQAKYPPTIYPFINERYNMVIDHMKNIYSIDLEGIAKGPQL